MTGDGSLGAALFDVLSLAAVIGFVAGIDLLCQAHRRGVARLRAHRVRQENRTT